MGITKPIGSVHKGQIYYRCYQHLSEDNGVRYVMGENLITNPAQRTMFDPATSPSATPVFAAAAPAPAAIAHGSHYDHQQHITVLRNIVAPGAISAWVQLHNSTEEWQQLLLTKVLEACRAVPNASVPDDLLVGEPANTGSLELVTKSLIASIGEACSEIRSSQAAVAAAQTAANAAVTATAVTAQLRRSAGAAEKAALDTSEAAAKEAERAAREAEAAVTKLITPVLRVGETRLRKAGGGEP